MRGPGFTIAAVVLLAACGGGDAAPIFSTTSQARVRFVNATTDVGGLNFAANGQTAVQGIAFGEPSTCQTFNPGAVTFGATTTGSTAAFGATLNQSLTANGRFTVIATGSSAVPQFLFLRDATTAPGTGRARVRIINAVPGTIASDIFITAPGASLGSASATNVGFNTGTEFLEVAAGQTQIRFANAGTQTVTFTGTPFTLGSGETTTVVVAPGTTTGTFRSFVVPPC